MTPKPWTEWRLYRPDGTMWPCGFRLLSSLVNEASLATGKTRSELEADGCRVVEIRCTPVEQNP